MPSNILLSVVSQSAVTVYTKECVRCFHYEVISPGSAQAFLMIISSALKNNPFYLRQKKNITVTVGKRVCLEINLLPLRTSSSMYITCV